MEIIKYSHACLVVKKDGNALVVDPGGWSTDLVIPDGVIGVVITHEHADHCDEELLRGIVEENPDAVVYAHADVVSQLTDFPTQAVDVNKTVHVGNFALKFLGGEHAVIHDSIPTIANLGVMIDEKFYYPGDSFALPDQPVELLAIPASAPWMKMSEAMDFLATVKPTVAFPTHDAILSESGKGLSDMLLGSAAEKSGTSYVRIQSGNSLTV